MQEPVSGTVYEELLALLPDNDNTRRSAMLADHAGVMEFLGLEMPDSGASDDVVLDLFRDITSASEVTGFAPSFPAWPSSSRDYLSVLDRYQYVGFEHWAVSQTANAGENPNTYDLALRLLVK